MEYTLINTDLTCGGMVGTEPTHNQWTLTPYLGGFVKENWNGTAWIEAATPEEIEQAFKDATPKEVQLWRLRTILKLMNLIATIESALDQLDEPTQTAAKNVWNYGTTVERYSQTVLFIQSVTQMTDDQVDLIFQQAEAIEI
jgi:hypothetical protein